MPFVPKNFGSKRKKGIPNEPGAAAKKRPISGLGKG